ncbi:hypothetical protein WMY93_005530 [Mugilogobius chulae]|uniref:LIM zinc-binding domain-containing protein n=1 Tax=Mugilogobius chulae TaxID=88201 RepID=A0AAW0PHB8_9GOBI
MLKWERLKMSDPSEESPVCQACLEKNYRSSFTGSSKAVRGHGKVVTFGAVTEIEQLVDTSEGEESELLRRLLSKTTVTMPTIGPGSRLSERERSLTDFTDLNQSALQTFSEVTPTPAEVDARLAQYMKQTEQEEEEEDEEEEKIPDLEKDDMMARRTGVFHKQSSSTKVYHNRFLPLPGTKNNAQDTTDHFPWSKKEVDASRNLRSEQTKVTMETFQPVATEIVKATTYTERNTEGEEGEESLPNPEKDDMMTRRAGLSQKPVGSKANQFLPVPGSVKYNVAPKQSRQKVCEKNAVERTSRRVAFISEDPESASMSDILNEDDVGHLPHISPSRYERMQEQYSNFKEDENQWQDDLARWKNRRRSASQDLIKKEEERKMIEKKMKEESDKRKSIKTYKEIIEEKERREAELCEAYKNAATPEEAAMVLQRYALRFTISDATLDSLKVPRPVVDITNPDKQQTDKDLKSVSPVKESEISEELHKTVVKMDKTHNTEQVDFTKKHEDLVCISSIPTPPISPVKTPELVPVLSPEQPKTHSTQPGSIIPPPPSRPVPLLAAKPWSSQSGHKSFKMDGLVRVNGETTEISSVHTPPISPLRSPEGGKPTTPRRKWNPPPSSAREAHVCHQLSHQLSDGGRNCIITTTIVTELTHVEPVTPERHSNGQVNGTASFTQETPEEQMSPVSSLPNSVQDFSPTVTEGPEDASLTEQYEMEQEKLKKEWERAQLEVEEEERKHNEEERRILEETVAPLNPTGIVSQHPTQTNIISPTEPTMSPLQHNGHKAPLGNEGQHASKLHFFQDSACEVDISRKQDLQKTESLDHSPQPKQSQNVKRSGSHDTAVGRQQSHPSPQPPSPSRCVSGKRLCSGCSQPLGKGAAMIIDTLGLFFHMQCFKCGVCDGQLGDATTGTDVRIRNGQLSCHECYIASRGRGQPTTL